MDFRYTIYGQSIKSELCLPELMPSSVQVEDVVIRRDRTGWQLPADALTRRHLRLAADEAYLAWDQIGIFLVRNGNEIVFEPHPHVDEEQIRLPLLSLVFAVLLYQRGYLVLHGSTVASGGRATAILGHKGYGKSTMAAALCRQGYSFVSDDTVALNMHTSNHPAVLPAFPYQKLWPDTLVALGENPEDFARLYASIEKRYYPIAAPYIRHSVPLETIYILAEGVKPEIVPLGPKEAMIQLLSHLSLASFGNQLLQIGDTSHFLHCAELARQVPVYQLRRPKSLELLEDSVRLGAMGIQHERLRYLANVVCQTPMRRLVYPNGLEHLPEVARLILRDLGK